MRLETILLMEAVEKKVRFLELIKIVMKKLYIKINIFSYGFWFSKKNYKFI